MDAESSDTQPYSECAIKPKDADLGVNSKWIHHYEQRLSYYTQSIVPLLI